MSSHWLLDRLERFGEEPALIWQNRLWSYRALCHDARRWIDRLCDNNIGAGQVVALVGDYSPQACAALIAAIVNRNIVVPLTSASAPEHEDFFRLTEASAIIRIDSHDQPDLTLRSAKPTHPLLCGLGPSAGLVLFSSGSTGPSKAVLLDVERLLAKFRKPRKAVRTLVFLLLDHIGGINTLFYALCNGGTIVTATDRSVDTVCTAIDTHQIQLLPTTPTFLRMMLIADAASRHSLRSLETVTYGTEPMPESTLAAVRQAFPWLRFKQTYGLSELGILPTRSENSDSLWIKLGSDGFETRIVDGLLWIRSQSAMLGYLNAPSPFDRDGWFNTQDAVEVKGDYIRILGRKSEFINVGGEKVHPAEVESVLLTLDNIVDATVFGRPNPVTGQVVCAAVRLAEPEDAADLRNRLRAACRARLQPSKVPVRIDVTDRDQHSDRFKKQRNPAEIGLQR